MDLKAKVASGYRTRLILIAVGALLYSAWAYYDATIKYPDKIAAFDRFDDLRTNNPDNFNQLWATVAIENGWDPDSIPEEVQEGDIDAQWWQFAITFPIGMYCLISLGLWSRRYLGADETNLYTHGRVVVPYDSITRIDAARWDTKGIAYIQYDLGHGEQSLLIDDWKYDRQPTDEIFDRVRDKVDDEKIAGMTDSATEDAVDDGAGSEAYESVDVAGEDDAAEARTS